VPDANHYLNAQGGTDDSSLTNANTFTLNMIDKGVERAKTLTPAIRPVKISGDEFYVAVLHPYAVTDMRTNTSTGQWEDLQKALMTGGVTRDNPIFTGALGIYNGCIIHSDVRVSGGFNAGTSVAVANTRRNIFLGAQAVMLAYGRDGGTERYTWVEELFDSSAANDNAVIALAA
jgi:N4-gp56 family major capsid protein